MSSSALKRPAAEEPCELSPDHKKPHHVSFSSDLAEVVGTAAVEPPSAAAKDVIKIRLGEHFSCCCSTSLSCLLTQNALQTVSQDQDAVASELPVEFTHQLFEDERIFGCEQAELAVIINYSSVALHCWVNTAAPDNADGAAVKDDILCKLAPVVPPDFTLDKQHFISQLPYNQQVRNHSHDRAKSNSAS